MAEKTVPAVRRSEAQVPATREESKYLRPPVDIYETNDSLVVVTDMPCVSADKSDIRVDNNVLTIRGEVKTESRGDLVAREFELYDFFRQFELSHDVEQEKITAETRNGVLTVHLPKREAAKPKQITVSVG